MLTISHIRPCNKPKNVLVIGDINNNAIINVENIKKYFILYGHGLSNNFYLTQCIFVTQNNNIFNYHYSCGEIYLDSSIQITRTYHHVVSLCNEYLNVEIKAVNTLSCLNTLSTYISLIILPIDVINIIKQLYLQLITELLTGDFSTKISNYVNMWACKVQMPKYINT